MNTDRKILAKTAILLCVGVAALALGSAVRGETGGHPARALVVKLKEKHSSGISGTATITPARKGVRVVLRLSGPVRESSPAHIHTGPCRREPTFANPRIANGLLSVVKGKSVTFVHATTLKRLRASRHSINVHDPNTLGVIACGDIPRAS
jgi:hypothetical protein